jgi:hypothetical protein
MKTSMSKPVILIGAFVLILFNGVQHQRQHCQHRRRLDGHR